MSTLKRYHDTMAQHLKDKTQLVDVQYPPSGRSLLEAPVGFLELSQIAMGEDAGTEELPLQLTWTLRILIASDLEDVNITLQGLLIEAAQAIYLQTFGLPLSPVTHIDFGHEPLQEAEAFLMGSVSWTQTAHEGLSVWEVGEGVPPHTVHAVWAPTPEEAS